MDQHTTPTILITGATGRVGTLLRAAWACDPPTGFVPLWQTRSTAQDGWFRWDMLAEPCPPFSPAPEVIVNFAGVTGAHSDRLWQNTALARAAHCAARQFRCRHLFLMSSAAVYGACTDDTPHDERSPLCPATPYGKAKVAMEHAAQRLARHHVPSHRQHPRRGQPAVVRPSPKSSSTPSRHPAPARSAVGSAPSPSPEPSLA